MEDGVDEQQDVIKRNILSENPGRIPVAKVKQQLKKKGVSDEVIAAALTEAQEERRLEKVEQRNEQALYAKILTRLEAGDEMDDFEMGRKLAKLALARKQRYQKVIRGYRKPRLWALLGIPVLLSIGGFYLYLSSFGAGRGKPRFVIWTLFGAIGLIGYVRHAGGYIKTNKAKIAILDEMALHYDWWETAQ